MADKDTAEAMEVMRGQAQVLGLKVDPLWSAEDFAQKIIDAQMALEAKAAEEFSKAKKVKVRMIRDGWPLSSTRVPAGKTVDIPIELAKRWLAVGACERTDPIPGLE